MGLGTFRFFSITDGAELVNHPLNGCQFEGLGPWVIRDGLIVTGQREYVYLYEPDGPTTPEGYRIPRRVSSHDFDGAVDVELFGQRFRLVETRYIPDVCGYLHRAAVEADAIYRADKTLANHQRVIAVYYAGLIYSNQQKCRGRYAGLAVRVPSL